MSASTTLDRRVSAPLSIVALCLAAPTLAACLVPDVRRRVFEGEFWPGIALAVVPLALVFTRYPPVTGLGRRLRIGLFAVVAGWTPILPFTWLLYALGANPEWAKYVVLVFIAAAVLLVVLAIPISIVAGLAAAVEGESLGFVAAGALAVGCMQLAVPFWGPLASAWLGR
jgi:hypothetical protein